MNASFEIARLNFFFYSAFMKICLVEKMKSRV